VLIHFLILVNFNGNINCNSLPLATTSNILYIDLTGLVSYGAVPPDLIPLNNITTWYEPNGDTMSYLVKNGVTSLKWVVFRTPTSYAYYDTIANVVSTTSDARTKKNIRPIDIEKSKQFILSITPSIFQHKDGDVTDTNIIGFIAQDILLNAKTEAQKNIVANWRPYEEAMAKQEEPKDILGVSSTLIIPELVGTIQLLNKQIEKLETQNKTLLERLEAIEYKIKRNDTILRY
jgi:hypothetical protein